MSAASDAGGAARVVYGALVLASLAVTALLLKEQGYDVVGLFMKNWEDDDTEEYCSSRQDLIDVMSVADRIGIDVEVVNFAAESQTAEQAGAVRKFPVFKKMF